MMAASLVVSVSAVRSERVRAVGILAATLCALGLIYVRNPSIGGYPPCVFHAVTGLYCPGCGSLRALHQLLHGHLLAALDFNPLMVLMLPVLGYAGLSQLSLAVRGRALPEPVSCARQIWWLFGIIMAYWVLRNIPAYPLSLLAP